MADNVNISEGLGKTIAADDVSGVMYQRVKVAIGDDGSATDLSASNPLPVSDAASQASLGTINTSVLSTATAIGAKSDAKSTATDTTSISVVSILKQISASIQAAAASLAGTLIAAVTIADNGHATFGAKADAKSTATDTTPITAMSVWKQISSSVQAIATSVAGTLTVATHAVTQSGTWTVQPGNTANTTAWKVDGSAVTQPVSLASVPSHAVTNAGTFAVQQTPGGSTTATATVVVSNASSVQLLASNANRKGFMCQNTDANPLYLKLGSTAVVASSWTIRIPQFGYYEMPAPLYTGRIDGIWGTAGSGSAFMTELT